MAEQARELVGADCCVATVAAEGLPRTAEAASYAEADRRWTTFVRWLDLFAIYRLVRRERRLGEGRRRAARRPASVSHVAAAIGRFRDGWPRR